MRRTWLMEDLEDGLRGESIAVYLHRKMAARWTLARIRDDLANRTGIVVSLATLSKWTRGMGYSKIQAAEAAWVHNLIRQSVLEQRQQRQQPRLQVIGEEAR